MNIFTPKDRLKNLDTLLKKVAFLGSLLLIINSVVSPLSVKALDPSSTEGVALMQIYTATTGSGWTNNTNWGSGPVENWAGVTVVNGKVTRLDLRSNNLVGTVPDVFAALPDLVFLHLKDNLLSGVIPSSIGSLVSLRFLGLNSNDFSGSVPASFGSLVNLTELYMHENSLSGALPDIH